MKKYIINILILALGLSFMRCSKQPYWDIPTDENGNIVITDVASTSSAGITMLDDNFTVTTHLPNAKQGDVMKIELLQLQTPPSGGERQLLPMAGTQKEVTLGGDLKATVNYTRNEAKLLAVGDYVTVTFAGKTDAATFRVNMREATAVSNPKYDGEEVDIIRGAGTASFTVAVAPAAEAYAGDVVVKRKNGFNEAWEDVGSFAPSAAIPVSGDDFAVGKDTMYYSFTTTKGSQSEEIIKQIIASSAYFFVRKAATVKLSGSQAGISLLTGDLSAADAATAVLAVTASPLAINPGANWATGGKSISFVPTTAEAYALNSVTDAKAAFAAGTPVASLNPTAGTGVYVFRLVNGGSPADILFGYLRINKINTGESIELEYRIGDTYAHRSVVE